MDSNAEILHERIGLTVSERILPGHFGWALPGPDGKAADSRKSLARIMVPALHSVVSAAWGCYVEFLREFGLAMPFALPLEEELKLCDDLLFHGRPMHFHFTSWHEEHLPHAGEHLCGKPSSAHQIGPADLRRWVFGVIGSRVLDETRFEPVISGCETSSIPLWGDSVLLEPLAPVKVDVRGAVARWISWRRIFKGGYLTTLGPLPFSLEELQLLLGSRELPDGIVREILDTLFVRAHRLTHSTYGPRSEGTRYVPAIVAAVLAWEPTRTLLTSLSKSNRSMQVSVAQRAVTELLESYKLPARRFTEAVDSKLVPKGKPSTGGIRPSGTPPESLQEELPSFQVYSHMCEILEVQSADSIHTLPGATEYSEHVKLAHTEPCLIDDDEHFLLVDVAHRIGIKASTIHRWLREGAVPHTVRYRTGRQRASYPVFSTTEIRKLWQRAQTQKAFAEILGISEQAYTYRIDKLKKLFPGLQKQEMRALLLRFRGEFPERAVSENLYPTPRSE
jgi:hypothetical protein